MSRFPRLFASGSSVRSATIWATVATFASVMAFPGSAHAQGLFQPPSPNLSAGTTPKGVAAADLTRSGLQSLVVTNSASSNMDVYLAIGPASFAPVATYTTCAGPTFVLAKDFNSDGYPDIAVACPAANLIDIFLNNGTGGFGAGPAATFSIVDPVALVAADFNGNGIIDGAVLSGTGGLTIILDPSGSEVIKTVSLSGTLTGIVTGDFNHDGHLDLAVSDSANNNVHLLTGDGTGNFTLLGSYSTGAGTKPSGIVAADFNNDGNLDVATVNSGNNTATVLLGSATGALTVQAAQATGASPLAIAVTDVNSDGKPDVVAFDSPTASTGEVDVLLGNGNGTLQTASAAGETFVPGTLSAVADFNQDGKPDLAVTEQTANQVTLLLNNTLQTQYPDGRSFAAAHALLNGYGNMADGVAVGDFNKDGKLDIAVSYLEDNAVRVLLNNGSGASNFNGAAVYPVGQQPYWVASADLNGDGYPDLVTANTTVNGANGTVSVLLNNGTSGNGTFAPAVNYTVGKQPYQVAIDDVNGDGYPDLAVTNYGANTVTVLFGSKTGAFTVQPTTLATCANPYGVAIGDFKHNGFPSIAVTCYSAAQAEVFPNNGNGTFGTPAILTTNVNPASLVIGDFNRDGNLDIVVGSTTANNISFFAGNGDNDFAAGVTSPSLNFPATIATGDVNGDGILDIVGVAPNFNDVVVTLGVGDGTFGTFAQRSAGEFTATKQPWGVALGDFNNDGQLDIVTANTYDQVNIASPTYQARYMTEYPPTPAGNPSIDVLTNASAANVSLATSPSSPIPASNTSVVLQATVQPAYSGPTPTGAVLFELETPDGTVYGPGSISGGAASYDVGHLDSGSYQFTALYSGDPNFQPATAVPTTITVAATQSVPSSGTTCNGTYTGTYHGPITISPGQNCNFISGGVSGGVTNNGGTASFTNATVNGGVTNTSGDLTVANSTVNGAVTVAGGTLTIGPGSTIHGGVTISGLSGSSSICGASMSGAVTVDANAVAVVFGNPSSCAANTVSGGVTFNNNSSVTVFDNHISGALTCAGNTAISGGGNTASSKSGQCATF